MAGLLRSNPPQANWPLEKWNNGKKDEKNLFLQIRLGGHDKNDFLADMSAKTLFLQNVKYIQHALNHFSSHPI